MDNINPLASITQKRISKDIPGDITRHELHELIDEIFDERGFLDVEEIYLCPGSSFDAVVTCLD